MSYRPLALFAAALTLSLTMTQIAGAQGFNRRDVAGATDLPATAQDFRLNNRTPLPPGYQGTPWQRICAWRPDGQVVTSAYYRGFPGEVRTCSVSQSSQIGGACRCGTHNGHVIETPV